MKFMIQSEANGQKGMVARFSTKDRSKAQEVCDRYNLKYPNITYRVVPVDDRGYFIREIAPMTWLTNSPEAAELLRQADARYAATRQAAEHLPLAAKIEAYRAAKERRVADYAAAGHGIEINKGESEQ
jgi:hypothetical protein